MNDENRRNFKAISRNPIQRLNKSYLLPWIQLLLSVLAKLCWLSPPDIFRESKTSHIVILCNCFPVFLVLWDAHGVSDICTLRRPICNKYLEFVLNLYLVTDVIDLVLSQQLGYNMRLLQYAPGGFPYADSRSHDLLSVSLLFNISLDNTTSQMSRIVVFCRWCLFCRYELHLASVFLAWRV